MNFGDLQERCWDFLGYPDAGQRRDATRQQIRDAVNTAILEIANSCPLAWGLSRESSLSIVAGTAVYTLDDWCDRALEFWVLSPSAQKCRLWLPREADRSGIRNTQLGAPENGPWHLTWYQDTTTAYKSGASGSSTGATVTEGAAAVSKGSSGTAFSASDVGRRFRLNGEDSDYQISGYTSATAITLDRAVRARLTGTGTTGVGAGYSNVRWEIGPAGLKRIQLLPVPAGAATLYYRYIVKPRRLVNVDDVPDVPGEQFHHLIWKGALAHVSLLKEQLETYGPMRSEFAAALADWRSRDAEVVADAYDRPYIRGLDDAGKANAYQPGTYFRPGVRRRY